MLTRVTIIVHNSGEVYNDEQAFASRFFLEAHFETQCRRMICRGSENLCSYFPRNHTTKCVCIGSSSAGGVVDRRVSKTGRTKRQSVFENITNSRQASPDIEKVLPW